MIVVFDTFDRVTREHPRLKSGDASVEMAGGYRRYKGNVKGVILGAYSTPISNESLNGHDGSHAHDRNDDDGGDNGLRYTTATAEFGSDYGDKNQVELVVSQTGDKRVKFIEPVARLGFGLAVRSALRMVETEFVWVQQHDWALVADIPLRELVEVMQTSFPSSPSSGTDKADEDKANEAAKPPIKYITFPSIRMLHYATSPAVTTHPTLRTITTTLQRTFTPPSNPHLTIPLTPLFFWFDKPHLAHTAHYLARVFPTRLAMRRGEFIEDKIGQRARAQMKEGNGGLWEKWACWLYYPGDGGRVCLRHLMGRTWRGVEGEGEVHAKVLEGRG